MSTAGSRHAFERDARAVSSHPSEVAPGDIAVGVVIGRTSEYFDYFVYGIASVLVFPGHLLPLRDRPSTATLLSFAVFALAFIARPFGTVLFMDIQRRWGRYTKLTLALFLLGIIHRGHRLPARVRQPGPGRDRLARDLPDRPGHCARRCLGRPAVAARADRAARQARLVRDAGAIGRADRLHHRQRALPVAVRDAVAAKISWTGAGAIPSSALSRSTWWRCSRAFGWWSPTNTTQLLTERELEPSPAGELLRSQGINVVLGAFGALASYALFHVVTVFPLA